jgi:hypothetical protein
MYVYVRWYEGYTRYKRLWVKYHASHVHMSHNLWYQDLRIEDKIWRQYIWNRHVDTKLARCKESNALNLRGEEVN